MRKAYRAGIATGLFTVVFLLLPGFRDVWPRIFGLACLGIFIPQFMACEEYQWRHRILVSALLCTINVLLIVFFSDKAALCKELKFYLLMAVVCFSVLFVKMIYRRIKRKKNGA
jgi:hypothetical protein